MPRRVVDGTVYFPLQMQFVHAPNQTADSDPRLGDVGRERLSISGRNLPKFP